MPVSPSHPEVDEGVRACVCVCVANASDFHLTLMMFIYFGENGKYTK